MNDLQSVVENALAEFAGASTPAELEDAKARYLGRNGIVTAQLKALGALSPEDKKARGAEINAVKQAIDAGLGARRSAMAEAELEQQLAAQALDVTLPGRWRGRGGLHPVSRALERIEAIFASLGFEVADGPEIETDWFSFTALNNPDNHPARSMQDTFYVDAMDDEGRLLNLRPHTSPMQIRHAQAHAKKNAGAATMPDVRVIAPGRTFRVDNDATHSPMFHQMEGLVIDKAIHMGHLKWTLETFISRYFETPLVETRFRPLDDETSKGTKQPEGAKSSGSAAKPVQFKLDDLKSGLFVEVDYKHVTAQNAASTVTVIRPTMPAK